MSNEVIISQMNEVIAEFMELEKEEEMYYTTGYRKIYLINGYWYPIRKLKYHTSWDWLMPVVKKIVNLVADQKGFTIPKNEYELDAFAILRRPIYTDISTIHNDVYQFITWYNQQKQTNETSTKSI